MDTTVGLHVSGPAIHIVGASRDQVAIHTNAGYGLLFDDCEGCSLREVTVTGGTRDPDERATDAGDRALPGRPGHDPEQPRGRGGQGVGPAHGWGQGGWNRRPVAREAVPEGFEIDGDLFPQNRQPGDIPREEETSRDRFRERFRLRMDDLVEYPVLRRSSFVRVYGSR